MTEGGEQLTGQEKEAFLEKAPLFSLLLETAKKWKPDKITIPETEKKYQTEYQQGYRRAGEELTAFCHQVLDHPQLEAVNYSDDKLLKACLTAFFCREKIRAITQRNTKAEHNAQQAAVKQMAESLALSHHPLKEGVEIKSRDPDRPFILEADKGSFFYFPNQEQEDETIDLISPATGEVHTLDLEEKGSPPPQEQWEEIQKLTKKILITI